MFSYDVESIPNIVAKKREEVEKHEKTQEVDNEVEILREIVYNVE